jgi:DNA mismatch repair protein MutL
MTARRVHVLPDAVANQIAAGEVVERPASVVKELVENALDALATRVEVAMERGGKRRIRVSDDGVGMGRADALLALDRHATSKIASADDLGAVRSFGFRGEALPSIAAVSRLTLETRSPEDEAGTRVRVNAGRILDVTDAARQRGTSVDVQTLFFNAPVRARFLRSVSVEARAVSEVVTTLALANPGVALSLTSDGRSLLELPASSDVADRVARIWGDESASTLLPVAFQLGDEAEVRGLVQRPDRARPGGRRVQLFVHGRPFRDRELVRAAERGYRTTVPDGARPWMFLYLTVPPGAVDVNVHPAKAEVRFRDRSTVEEVVEAAVRAALAGVTSSATLDTQLAPPRLAVRERDTAPGAGRAQAEPTAAAQQMALFLAGPERGAEPAADSGADSAADPTSGDPFAAGDPPAPTLAQGRPRLYQLHRTWILAEAREGLLIIDQHSAHERVLFERLMNAYAGGGQEAQRLLFPLTFRLTADEVQQVDEVRGLLERTGFEVEPFGSDTVIVHGVPNPHPWFDAERCFREMVAELTAGTSELVRSARNQHERIAMTFACKGAIKAGHALGEGEMQELFDALFATELPWHDVHGRPTVVRLPKTELERKFKRG